MLTISTHSVMIYQYYVAFHCPQVDIESAEVFLIKTVLTDHGLIAFSARKICLLNHNYVSLPHVGA